MKEKALVFAKAINAAATVVIQFRGLGGRLWKRNVANGPRIGPWLQAEFDIVNQEQWKSKGACLYLVSGTDEMVRYVGMSRNGLRHRWRTSPAFDAETMQRLPQNQLFHSQCWKHIEAEAKIDPAATFVVRSIAANPLLVVLGALGPPLSGFMTHGDDGESVVASVERWLCNHSSINLARWNSAMAGGSKV